MSLSLDIRVPDRDTAEALLQLKKNPYGIPVIIKVFKGDFARLTTLDADC